LASAKNSKKLEKHAPWVHLSGEMAVKFEAGYAGTEKPGGSLERDWRFSRGSYQHAAAKRNCGLQDMQEGKKKILAHKKT